MSCWVGTILVAVITMLVTVLFFTIKANVHMQKELDVERMSRSVSDNNLLILREKCQELERQLAFRDGLKTGRRTDTLYRQLLKQFTNGEQFTVMMNGIKEDNNG